MNNIRFNIIISLSQNLRLVIELIIRSGGFSLFREEVVLLKLVISGKKWYFFGIILGYSSFNLRLLGWLVDWILEWAKFQKSLNFKKVGTLKLRYSKLGYSKILHTLRYL